jgi:hypothetical protein
MKRGPGKGNAEMNTDSNNADSSNLLSLSFDVEAYMQYVQEFDLTDAQSREVLSALWSCMVGFVDLGFRIHPVQQAREAVHEPTKSLSADSGHGLASLQVLTPQFTKSAAPIAERSQGRKES